jgi:hypothetical protein
MTWNFTGFNKYIPELCKGSLLGLTWSWTSLPDKSAKAMLVYLQNSPQVGTIYSSIES